MRRPAILNRTLDEDEAVVIVQARGRPPLLMNGPASVRTFWRWRRVIFVDLRPLTLGISVDDVTTRDGVGIAVRGELTARVVRPVDAATKVVDYSRATSQIAEAALRRLIREWLSGDLAERLTELESELLGKVGSAAEAWGVSVSAVRIQLG